jgi:hypothetical protein
MRQATKKGRKIIKIREEKTQCIYEVQTTQNTQAKSVKHALILTPGLRLVLPSLRKQFCSHEDLKIICNLEVAVPCFVPNSKGQLS